MPKIFSVKQLLGRFDCFSQFNRSDPICLKHCALNIRCALAKKQWYNLELNDYYPPAIPADPDLAPE